MACVSLLLVIGLKFSVGFLPSIFRKVSLDKLPFLDISNAVSLEAFPNPVGKFK